MLASCISAGDEEKAIEDANRKKEKEAELAKKKRNQGEADDSHVQEPSKELVPPDIAGVLTHHCTCIFEILEMTNAEYSSFTAIGVSVVYQNHLDEGKMGDTWDEECLGLLKRGPIALMIAEDICGEDHANMFLPPKWWDQCSAQLERSCHATLPAGSTNSEYVRARVFSNFKPFGIIMKL